MNEIERALQWINGIIDNYGFEQRRVLVDEAHAIRIALKKQIPKEHHHTKIAGFKEVNPKMRFSVCPQCLSVIVTSPNEYPKYCAWCGQVIDWSVEE